LPRAGVVRDRIGDQLPSDCDAVDLGEIRLDKAAAVESEDLLVEPLEPPLTLLTICKSNVPLRSLGASI
jgi:hypothetical protein